MIVSYINLILLLRHAQGIIKKIVLGLLCIQLLGTVSLLLSPFLHAYDLAAFAFTAKNFPALFFIPRFVQ
jgi:hypothetical protein